VEIKLLVLYRKKLKNKVIIFFMIRVYSWLVKNATGKRQYHVWKTGRKSMFLCVVGDSSWGILPGLWNWKEGGEESPHLYAARGAEIFLGRFPPLEESLTREILFPFLFARGALLETGFPAFIVRSGSWKIPEVPFIEMGGTSPEYPLSLKEEEKRFNRALQLGREIGKFTDRLVLGNCVPGGALGSLLLLRGLGCEDEEELLSDVPDLCSQRDLLWKDFSSKTGVLAGGLQENPWEALLLSGDPSLSVLAGIAAGVPRSCSVVLAGDLSMLGVGAFLRFRKIRRSLLLDLFPSRDEKIRLQRGRIAKSLQLGYREIASGELERIEKIFSKNDEKDLMGMAGVLRYAEDLGVSREAVFRRARDLYDLFLGIPEKRGF